MQRTNSVVAIYEKHTEAEAAVKQLERAGFDMQTLSIVGKSYHTEEHVMGYFNAGDRMLFWGQQGAFWGALWSILFGSAFIIVPGVGPLLVAGPLVAWMLTVLEGAAVVGGVSALGGALASIGIPNDSIVQYETEIKAGKFMMVVNGTREEISRAEATLSGTGSMQVETHFVETPQAVAV
jgi:uncharacterized membrane protein